MPNIIHIRGTSGSGKSHLARRIQELYLGHLNTFRAGRKRPLYTVHTHEEPGELVTIGHYDTDCGGADTITSMDDIHEIVAEQFQEGKDVLFEGLLSTPEFNRTVKLQSLAGDDLHVIFLTTPLDLCVASVNERRAAKAERTGKAPPPPLNPKNTEAKYKSCKNAAKKLRDAGVQVHELDREAAFLKVRGLLGV